MIEAIVAFFTRLFAPTTPLAPNAAPYASLEDRVTAIVLAHNNGKPILRVAPVWKNPLTDSVIHRIGASAARTVAKAVLVVEPDVAKLPYVLACLAIESAFDPSAQNGNWLGSNKAHDPAGYDVGVAQLKLRYLLSKTMVTVGQARLFALDPYKAIVQFKGLMDGHLAWAQAHLADGTIAKPQLRNVYYVATGAYQEGEDGMARVVAVNALLPHSDQVVAYERDFAKSLGVASVFGDLP